MLPKIMFAFAVLLLAGCSSLHVMSHVPLSTMSRLSALKLGDIEPTQLRVAARLPVTLEPRPLGVKIRMSLSRGGSEAQTEDFVLVAIDNVQEHAALKRFVQPEKRLWIYGLSPKDVARVTAIMDDLGAHKSTTGVSIAAGVDACHRESIEDKALPTSTYLRANTRRAADGEYMVLIDDLDLRSVVAAADLSTRVPPCR